MKTTERIAHTLGPWTVVQHGFNTGHYQVSEVVLKEAVLIDSDGDTEDQIKALWIEDANNAKLIGKCPELLAGLERAAKALYAISCKPEVNTYEKVIDVASEAYVGILPLLHDLGIQVREPELRADGRELMAAAEGGASNV